MYKIDALTYNAQTRPEWFTRAYFGGTLISRGIVSVLTGIKGDELLNMLDLENKVLQFDGQDCAWTPNQILKLSDKLATIKTYKINVEECIDTLEKKRTAYMLTPGAKNEMLPPELEAATLTLMAIALSNEIEELLVAGNEAVNSNDFDGLKTILLKAGSGATKISSDAFTVGNVLDQLSAGYDGVKEDVIQAEDRGALYCLVSYATRRKIRKALAIETNQVLYPEWSKEGDNKNPVFFYNGMEVIPVKGIGDNTAIIFAGGNWILTTDLESDLENLELGQFPAPHDNKVYIRGRLRLGCVVPFPDECVIIDSTIQDTEDGPAYPNDIRISPINLVFSGAQNEVKTVTVVTDADAEIVLDETDKRYSDAGFTATVGDTVNGITAITITNEVQATAGEVTNCEVIIRMIGSDHTVTLPITKGILTQEIND